MWRLILGAAIQSSVSGAETCMWDLGEQECCSFMAIIGQKSFGPVLRSLDLSESQTKELEFKGLVLRFALFFVVFCHALLVLTCTSHVQSGTDEGYGATRLVCRPRENEMLQQQVVQSPTDYRPTHTLGDFQY